MANRVQPAFVQTIDGVLWGGWRWDTTHLNYAFPTSVNQYAGYSPGDIQGFDAFSSVQKTAAKQVVKAYADVCGLSFTLSTPANGNIRFAEATLINTGDGAGLHRPGKEGSSDPLNPPDSAEAVAPDDATFPAYAQGDTFFNHTTYNNPVRGSFGFTAGIMHEMGHALGLKHGHVAQNYGDSFNFPALPDSVDSQEFTVMTYKRFIGEVVPNGNNHTTSDFPTTPMMLDIRALQYLYGPDYNTNSGNTVYKWSPVNGATIINGVSQGATFHHKIFLTVWDGGGKDTYDFSNYHSNAVINLNPGAWSTPSPAQKADLSAELSGTHHFARGSIANAFLFNNNARSLIENAVGSKGSDSITGNVASNSLNGIAGNDNIKGLGGNDVLIGGLGKDLLHGGPNADRFDFNAPGESKSGGLRDQILDFSSAQHDKIDLSTIDANAHAHGNQAFHFIGASGFHHQGGELRFAGHVLEGDVNGDGKADFQIFVNAAHLTAGPGHDFLL
jgi:serralysin